MSAEEEITDMDTSATPTVPPPGQVHFSTIDMILFIFLLVVSMGIGLVSAYRNRRSTSTTDYLIGSKAISPIAVSLSLLGGVVSAIAILGFASESYFYGTQYSCSMLGMVLGGLLVYHIILPVLYNLNLVSMCQYLELRFESVVLRLLASVCQIVSMVLLMAVVLYAPSLALSTVTNLSSWASILIMGAVCTVYTTIGGVRGVVYTDVLQTIVMFLGVFVIVVVGSVDMGGPEEVWRVADEGKRIQIFEMNTDPFIRHTFWSTTVVGLYLILFFFGFNQASHQRFSSVNSLAMAKRLCIVAVGGCILLLALCTAAGLVAYTLYSDCDPLKSGKIKKPDQVLPYLVIDKLGHLKGVPGIFVASVYGGVLSSVSSCGNSLACMVWDDFLSHIQFFSNLGDRRATTTLKLLTFVFGVLGVALALGVGRLGNILQVANSLIGAVNGPLIGLYFAGILSPWVGHKGATIGFLTTLALNIWFMVGSIMRGKTSPATLPLSTISCPATNTNMSLNNQGDITTNMSLSDEDNNHGDIITTTLATVIESVMEEDGGLDVISTPSRTLYDISYCYIGVVAILLTIIISSLASLITGMNSPWDVDDNLVHPLGSRFHRFLWRIMKCRKTGGQEITMNGGGKSNTNKSSLTLASKISLNEDEEAKVNYDQHELQSDNRPSDPEIQFNHISKPHPDTEGNTSSNQTVNIS